MFNTILKNLLLNLIFFRKNKVIFLAFILSILIHFIFFTQFQIHLSKIEHQKNTLNVSLTHSARSNNKLANQSKKIPNTVNSNPIQHIKNMPKIANIVEFQSSDAYQVLSSLGINYTATLTREAETGVALNLQPIDDIHKLNERKTASPVAYQYVETEYDVSSEANSEITGTVITSFNIDKNGTYVLNSTSTSMGLQEEGLAKLSQRSEGIVNENGLVPSYYSIEYHNNPNKSQRARFSWSEQLLRKHNAQNDSAEELPKGTLDELSFMYQFMFYPPLNQSAIFVANGMQIQIFNYEYIGQETITTKLGDMNTFHLISENKADMTELWLSVNYQYLPIKIRHTLIDGKKVDETARKITTVNK